MTRDQLHGHALGVLIDEIPEIPQRGTEIQWLREKLSGARAEADMHRKRADGYEAAARMERRFSVVFLAIAVAMAFVWAVRG